MNPGSPTQSRPPVRTTETLNYLGARPAPPENSASRHIRSTGPPKDTRHIAAARDTTLKAMARSDKCFTLSKTPLPDSDRLPFAVMAFNHRELEESITHLDSVDAARVVTDGSRVSEVHVIAAPGKPAKQVVRDVQSLAMARFGATIDRRVVSVVQISPTDIVGGMPTRPALVGVNEEPNGTRTTLKVTLRFGDEDRTGSAVGPAVASTRLRLIGEATIDAVERTFDGVPPIALDAVSVTTIGSRRVIVAIVVSADGGGELLTVGSALSSGDDGEATVKAVLGALNRRIERIKA